MHIITLLPVPALQLTNGKIEESSCRISFAGIVVSNICLGDVVQVVRNIFGGVESMARVHVVDALVEWLKFCLGKFVRGFDGERFK